MTDDVTLTVGGAALAGWTDVRVTRRLEGCPNDFEIGMTERFPGEANDFVVQAGQPCVLAIGGDTVITGYVDRYTRNYDGQGRSHNVTISGRGMTQDLVDCSAEWPGGQIVGTNVADVATKLAAPYGIEVTTVGEDQGPAIPQFNLTLGETPWDIIERICRYAGLLAYEETDGHLILASGADIPAASGFSEGANVQAARVMSSMDQRYSEIDCYLLSMDVLGDAGVGGNLLAKVFDPNVPRHRLLYLIAEAGGGGQDVCKLRAIWEVARRSARSFVVQVTADSWRDSGGNLWAPNTLAPVSLPGLKVPSQDLLIGEVTFRRALGTGTTVDVMLMKSAAFKPEPILLQPQLLDVNPATPAAG